MSERRFTYVFLFTLALLLVGSAAVALLFPPRHEQALRLLLITSGSETQQQALADGARAAAAERGVELSVRSLDPSTRQSLAESITSVIADGVQGAIVCQEIGSDTVPELRRVAGLTNIITCGADVGAGDRLVHVGANPYSAGRICASLVKETLPAGGRIVVLRGGHDDVVAATRFSAFQEALQWDAAGPSQRWKIVSQLVDGDSSDDLDRNLEVELERHADISCVVDLRHSPSRALTARLAGIASSDQAKFITFDHSDDALAAVETGEVFAVIGENSFKQGYQAVEHLASICRGNDLRRPAKGAGQVNVPASIVRQGNVAEYRAHVVSSVMSPAA